MAHRVSIGELTAEPIRSMTMDRRGKPWTKAEDAVVRRTLRNGGGIRWREVAARLGRGHRGTRTRARYLRTGQHPPGKRGDPDAPRRAQRWTEEEEEVLWAGRNLPIEELAVHHGRSPCACATPLSIIRKRKGRGR